MFHLALTFGLEKDPLSAIARTTGFIEAVAKKHGVTESVWMTLGISDGKTLWGFRYGSDGDAPTLYHSREVSELVKFNPLIHDRLSRFSADTSCQNPWENSKKCGQRFRKVPP